MGKPGVMIYFETARAIKGLDYETKGRLFEAIMEYAENGTVPAFDGVLAAVWPFVSYNIDKDTQRYESIREKRAQAGRKGGEARANNMKQNLASEANATCVKQIKPTSTSTSTSTSAAESAAHARKNPTSVKHKHCEYSNVLLSDEDMEKLQAEFPEDWQARIDRLSEYIASTGKTYKNHLATLRAWARKDAEKEVKPYARDKQLAEEWGGEIPACFRTIQID